MRARMAIVVSAQSVELREVVLRNKPPEMVAASPKATVPVLIDIDGAILDESLDIMFWALERNDPQNWLWPEQGDTQQVLELVAEIDGPFKQHLDRYKYSARYGAENNGQGVDPAWHREAALTTLRGLDDRLTKSRFMFGQHLTLADVAIAPLIRQFAHTDMRWFAGQPLAKLQHWLEVIIASDLFGAAMRKYAPWQSETKGIVFPDSQAKNAAITEFEGA